MLLLISVSYAAQAQPIVHSNGATVSIMPGLQLSINGDASASGAGEIANNGDIHLRGNLTNNAENDLFTGVGKLTLDSESNQFFSGSQRVSLNELEISKEAGTLSLETDVWIEESLSMTKGNINLMDNDIELSSTAELVGESLESYILGNSGVIKTTRTLSSSDLDTNNVAGLGAILYSADDFGETVIERGHSVYEVNGTPAIARYFHILPENNGGLNATLFFSYLDVELNGHSESALQLHKSEDGGTNWDEQDATLDYSNNIAAKTGISTFSWWTMSTEGSSLPIELLSFTAAANGNNTVLEWYTNLEINSDYFTIEHSPDGMEFSPIGQVSGAGNSTEVLQYEYLHKGLGAGTHYYRLKQTDYDGSYSYSHVEVVHIKDIKQPISLYPNPLPSGQMLNISGLQEKAVLQLYTVSGQLISTYELTDNPINQVDIDHLKPGTYIYCIKNQGQVFRSDQLTTQ